MLKTASSVINAIGALNYQGTWDASTNTPTLTSSVGTKGDYYVVSVAGNTNLNGITNWGIGDWAVFNGSTWQRVEGGSDGNFANLSVSNLTGYMYANGSNNVTASTTIPNAGLVNNSVVIGNTTVSLGSTVSSFGNVTLTNANIASVSVKFPNSLIANVTATLGNANVTLGSTTTSVGNLTLSNANITSLAATFPNSYLSNSSVTLGNTSATLGSTVATVGNLTLTGATVTGNVSLTNTTNASATFATSSLLLVPEGYVIVSIGGVNKKIPYYAV